MTDLENMQPIDPIAPSTANPASAIAECLAPMQLHAFTVDEPQRLMQIFPGAVTAIGGWLLLYEPFGASGARVSFEFERSSAVDIYAMLVGLRLELTRSSHLALTDFCQRTLQLSRSDNLQVARCELEIWELVEDSSSREPLQGGASSA